MIVNHIDGGIMVDKIEGVIVTPLRCIATPKGDVLHAMKRTDEGFAGFGEVYFSEVFFGDVKGWKRHNRMTLNLVVVHGTIRFIIYDDREGSATKGCYQEVYLSPNDADSYCRLTVAPGLWMAFEGCDENKGTSLLMDLIPEIHDPAEADRCELSEIEFPDK